MFTSPQNIHAKDDLPNKRSSFSKATMMLTGSAPPIHKQIKTAIMEGNEDKAISLYMSKDGSKVHPSKAIPSKKAESNEDTPMHLAAKYVLLKLFKMFIEYGGHPGTLNARHENCAHAVCLMSSFPAKRADFLDVIYDWRTTRPDNTLDYVYIDQVDVEGNSALHIAAFNGLLPCVERLIKRGATVSLMNHYDLSACDMADRGGHLQLGTMLELAWIFQYDTTAHDVMHALQKHTKDNKPSGRILLDGVSVPLTGFIEFMNKAIKTSADVLAESPARAEALLNCYAWDVKLLKKEFTVSKEKTLATARLKPRVILHEEVKKESEVECGISVEECYLDPCYSVVASFNVTRDNKKFAYTFHHFDGKAAVHPLDYNPSLQDLDKNTKVSALSHVQPKETERCSMCGNVMLEPASIHNFLTGTIVEAQRRELPCGSGHKYCINCWSDHIQMTMKRDNNVGHLSCPSANCGEVLDIQWAPVLLKKSDLVNRLLAQRQKHVIEALNLRWCPVAGCGLLVHVQSSLVNIPSSGNAAVAPTITSNVSSTCMPCNQPPKAVICGNGHAFCLQCSKEAHSPCKCADVAIWSDWLREESTAPANGLGGQNALANMMLYYSDQKHCFACNGTIVKEDGCNIVRCATCQIKYCWMCMQPWNTHANRNNSVLFCNQYHEQNDVASASHDGIFEEKSDDIAIVHKKLKHQRFNRLLHYNYRHMTHGESLKLENMSRKVVEERIYNGLVASFDGDLIWLQGDRVQNPLQDKAKEMEAYNAIRGLEGNGVINISDYYLPREEAIEFLIDAFDELEKCRSFLKWTYPFMVIEFDDKFIAGSSKASPFYRAKEIIDEQRMEFEGLQGSLEYFTECLSDLIARKRIRATKANILAAYHLAKEKRLEFEQFVFSFYTSHNIQSVEEEKATGGAVLSTSSSLTSWDSKEKDRQASADKKPFSPRNKSTSDDIQERDMDAVFRGISTMSSPKATIKPLASDSESDSDEEEVKPFAKPTLQHKPSSYFQAAVNISPPASAIPPPLTQKSRSFYRTNSAGNIVANHEPVATPVSPPQRAVEVSSDSEDDRRAMPVAQPVEPQPSPPVRGLTRVGSLLNASMVSGATTTQRKKIVIQSLYLEQQVRSPETLPEPEPIPSPLRSPEPQKRFEVVREKPPAPPQPQLPQYIIEQRLIAAKKDPDQEALEHAIMISKQEEDYGINMYDALTDADEPIIEEYIAQGFTREEAILIIFEEKVGIQRANAITPAMPTLHKVTPDAPVPLPPGFTITEEVEREIESLMRKGFTREQAIEVLADKRRREQAAELSSRDIQAMEMRESMVQQTRTESRSRDHSSMGELSDDAKIAQLMARGMTMEQALAVIHEEKRGSFVSSSRSVSHYDDNSSVNRSRPTPARSIIPEMSYSQDEDPEIAHLMSKGYTREQAVQVASSSRSRGARSSDRRSMDAMSRDDDYSVNRGFGSREGNTAAMLQRMTAPAPAPMPAPAPPNDNYGRNYGSSGASVGPMNGRAQSMYGMMPPAPPSMPMPMSAPAPQQALPPPRNAIFRASMQNMYEAPGMQEDPYYGGAPMGLGAGSSDFLPPPRNGPRSGSAGSTDNINMANGYGAPQQPGTSYYGSTVVGDYDYLPPHTQLPPQPGPMQDDARNALLAQQQAEFGIHMYDAVTPADGPEIRRLMSEGYTEDDAIQMLFDFRYRHQSGRSQPYGMQLQPPMPAPQSPRQVGSGMSVGGGGPRQAPLSRGPSLNSHSTGDLYSPQAAEQHRRLQHDDGHSHSMYVGQQSTTNTAPQDGKKPPKRLVSRVSSIFHKDKVKIEGDPMTHAIRQSQMEMQKKQPKMKYKPSDVKQLTKMGFNEAMAVQALLENDSDVNAAANALMNNFNR